MGMIFVTLMVAPPSLLRLRCSTWRVERRASLKNPRIIYELIEEYCLIYSSGLLLEVEASLAVNLQTRNSHYGSLREFYWIWSLIPYDSYNFFFIYSSGSDITYIFSENLRYFISFICRTNMIPARRPSGNNVDRVRVEQHSTRGI